MRRIAGILLLVALAASGCAGDEGARGRAELWITRDRGTRVLLERDVAAGQTVLDALREHADVETRYGGRFVGSIDGLSGSLTRRRDWFFFVNGFESDRSAAEYRLHAGDIVWWDFRAWSRRMSEPVVVGAFPEPFVHGYDGERRAAAVRYGHARQAAAARRLGDLVRADSVEPAPVPVPADANVLRLVGGPPRFRARLRSPGEGAGGAVEFVLGGDPRRLARNPELARFRYEGMP